MHYPSHDAVRNYPISAIFMDTPSVPMGPAAHPGNYTVRLTVDGQSITQPLTIKMDPRVPATPEVLAQQYALSMQCYRGVEAAREMQDALCKVREQIRTAQGRSPTGELAQALTALDQKANAIVGAGGGGGRRGGGRRGGRGGGAAGDLGKRSGRDERPDGNPAGSGHRSDEPSGQGSGGGYEEILGPGQAPSSCSKRTFPRSMNSSRRRGSRF